MRVHAVFQKKAGYWVYKCVQDAAFQKVADARVLEPLALCEELHVPQEMDIATQLFIVLHDKGRCERFMDARPRIYAPETRFSESPICPYAGGFAGGKHHTHSIPPHNGTMRDEGERWRCKVCFAAVEKVAL